jgi:GxxExxY protein
LIHELGLRGIKCQAEPLITIGYKDISLDTTLRCDIIVEDILVVELKAFEKILPIHEAQILTYMKLLCAPECVIFNFNVVNLYSEGQKTYVNEWFRGLPD